MTIYSKTEWKFNPFIPRGDFYDSDDDDDGDSDYKRRGDMLVIVNLTKKSFQCSFDDLSSVAYMFGCTRNDIYDIVTYIGTKLFDCIHTELTYNDIINRLAHKYTTKQSNIDNCECTFFIAKLLLC